MANFVDSRLKFNDVDFNIPNIIQSVSTTIFFYYSILHFDEESRNWTWGKALYLATRYTGALFNTFVLVGMMSEFENEFVFPNGELDLKDMSKSELFFCLRGYLYIGLGVVPIIFAESILALRVYAIYGKNRRILIFLVIIFLGSFAVNVAQSSGILTFALEDDLGQGTVSTYTPFNASLDINALCSVGARPMAAIAWAVTATVELILFVMVLIKYRQLDLGSPTSRYNIVDTFARDSSVYFGILLLCSIPPTVIPFLSESRNVSFLFGYAWAMEPQRNALQTIVVTVMSLLAPQMIINLRRKYHDYYAPSIGSGTVISPDRVSFDAQELTWNANRSQISYPIIYDSTVFEC